jgi:hypothetical protein
VIFRLAQICLAAEDAEFPASASEWEGLVNSASARGVAGLLWLRAHGRDIPAEIREKLKTIYLRNLARGAELQREAARARATLEAQGVAVWPLKGTALSAQLYGDVAARDTSDIDLLIPRQQFPAADAALTALGYARSGVTREQASELQEVFYARRVSEPPDGNSALSSARILAVDLHLGLMPYGLPDPLAERIRMQGMTAENLLVFLAVNAVVHRLSELKHVLDVAALLQSRRDTWNWDAVISAARGLAFSPGVWMVLARCAELARVELPPAVDNVLRPCGWQQLALAEWAGSASGEFVAGLEKRNSVSGILGMLLCTRLWGERWQVMAQMMFPAEAYVRQELNASSDESLLPLYLRRFIQKLGSVPAGRIQ